jgi:hypothetical protein
METIFRFLFVFKSERKIRVSQITAKVDYEIEAEINSRRSSMTAQKKSENKRASTTDVDDSDLVATWNVPMSDKVYKIEFEHGTTTGKRQDDPKGNNRLCFSCPLNSN